MPCKIIRNSEGQIEHVYNDRGQPSVLYNMLKNTLPTPNIAYAVYLRSMVEQSVIGIKGEPAYEDALPFVQEALKDPFAYEGIIEEAEVQLAEEKLLQSVYDTLETLGIDITVLETLEAKVDTELLGRPVGKAKLAQKLIQVINTYEIGTRPKLLAALAEESSHFIVEYLRHNDSSLYKSMYKEITKYQIYYDISQPGSFYHTEYKGDIDMLKREAIAKVVTMHALKQPVKRQNDLTLREEKENISRIQRWWNKVITWFRNMFKGKMDDPYLQASERILNNDLEDFLKKEGKLKGRLADQVLDDAEFFKAETAVKEESKTDHRDAVIKKLDSIADEWYSDEVRWKDHIEDNPEWSKIAEESNDYIERYINKRTGRILSRRVSDAVALLNRKKYGKIQLSKEEKEYYKAVQAVRMAGGQRFHKILEELGKLHTGQSSKTISSVFAESGLSKAQFNELDRTIKNLISHANALQNQIDPKEKPKFKFEQFVLNDSKQTGGTIDLLVLFSNNTAAIYDFKFKTPSTLNKGQARKTVGGYEILKDFFADSIDQWDVQISSYKETLIKKYGVRDIIESRIIPASVVYQYDKDGTPLKIIEDIKMGGPFLNKYEKNPAIKKELESASNLHRRFLDPIAVSGERPRDEKGRIIKSLDELITLETRRLTLLREKLKDANYKEQIVLKKRIKDSIFIIRQMQVNKDIGAGLLEAHRIMNRASSGLGKNNKYKEDGSIEELYIDDTELLELYQDLKYFQSFLGQDEYLNFLKRYDKKKYDSLIEALEKSGKINRVLDSIKSKMVERMVSYAEERGVKGLNTFNRSIDGITSNFTALSTHSNPFQRTLYETLDSINTQLNKVSKNLAIEIEEKTNALKEYGASIGLSGTSVFDLLIDQERMMLHPKWSPQFKIDKEKALNKARTDAAGRKSALNWIKEYYELDIEKYDKLYKKWEEGAFRAIATHNISPQEKKRKQEAWKKRWDLKNHPDTAFLNYKNLGTTGFAKLKKSAELKYLSEEYKRIQQVPALKDFYEYHRKMVWKFSKLFGKDLGSGFIANVHKGIIDTWVENGFNPNAMTDVAWNQLQVREHDLSLNHTDLEGNHLRRVPRLFTRQIFDKDGNLDNSLKTKDLGKSLYLLGVAAYQYSFNNDVVPQMLMLETLLKDNIVRETAEDKRGKLIMETLHKAKVTLSNTNTETFTDSLEMNIFGRHLKTKDGLSESGLSRNKTILQLKTVATVNALGLRIPVALGALGAGMVGLEVQATKGLFYSKKDLRLAQKMLATQDPKMRAIMEFFDISLEDLRARRGDLLSSTFRGKYMNTDRWFELLARADRGIDALASVAMANSHGVHPETGKVERLKDLPEGTKSILETIEFKEDSKWKKGSPRDRYIVTIPGIKHEVLATKTFKDEDERIKSVTEVNAYRKFKAKVRRISMSIKGTMDQDDKMLFNGTLYGKLLLHYRSWLPGIALERFGRIRYDYILDHFQEGTWKSLFNNIGKGKPFKNVEEALNTEVLMHMHFQEVMKDGMKVALDIATFGYTSAFKVKEEIAINQFNKFLLEQHGNPEFMKGDRLIEHGDAEYDAKFKKFIELKRANIKAVLAELRAVILLGLTLMMMGGDWDDDDEIDMRQTWAGRKLHNVFHRVYREVAFFWDPLELSGPRSTGIPLLQVFQNGYKWVSNSLDEVRDAAFGENSERDRTPWGYYTFKFLPPLDGIGAELEIFEAHKYRQY